MGSAANSTYCGSRTRVCAKRASARCAAANDGMIRSRIAAQAGVAARTRPISGNGDASGVGGGAATGLGAAPSALARAMVANRRSTLCSSAAAVGDGQERLRGLVLAGAHRGGHRAAPVVDGGLVRHRDAAAEEPPPGRRRERHDRRRRRRRVLALLSAVAAERAVVVDAVLRDRDALARDELLELVRARLLR